MGTIVGNFLRLIVRLFRSLTEKTKELAPEIIKVVSNIKNFVDSPECDFLTAVIPGTLDDSIQAILKKYLPVLLTVLNTSKDIANIEDENERLKAIVKEFQLSSDDAKDILYHGIAGKLIEVVTGNPWGKSAIVAEVAYKNPELLDQVA